MKTAWKKSSQKYFQQRKREGLLLPAVGTVVVAGKAASLQASQRARVRACAWARNASAGRIGHDVLISPGCVDEFRGEAVDKDVADVLGALVFAVECRDELCGLAT